MQVKVAYYEWSKYLHALVEKLEKWRAGKQWLNISGKSFSESAQEIERDDEKIFVGLFILMRI